jgi:glutathione S-transferase
MAVKLHRCPFMFLKMEGHGCWRVQKALEDEGIEYELVKAPLRRGAREDVERVSGQRVVPVIEFEDGSAYRAESKEMAERIRAGRLFEADATPTG